MLRIAAERYEHARQMNPTDSRLHLNLGIVRLALGEPNLALSALADLDAVASAPDEGQHREIERCRHKAFAELQLRRAAGQ